MPDVYHISNWAKYYATRTGKQEMQREADRDRRRRREEAQRRQARKEELARLGITREGLIRWLALARTTNARQAKRLLDASGQLKSREMRQSFVNGQALQKLTGSSPQVSDGLARPDFQLDVSGYPKCALDLNKQKESLFEFINLNLSLEERLVAPPIECKALWRLPTPINFYHYRQLWARRIRGRARAAAAEARRVAQPERRQFTLRRVNPEEGSRRQKEAKREVKAKKQGEEEGKEKLRPKLSSAVKGFFTGGRSKEKRRPPPIDIGAAEPQRHQVSPARGQEQTGYEGSRRVPAIDTAAQEARRNTVIRHDELARAGFIHEAYEDIQAEQARARQEIESRIASFGASPTNAPIGISPRAPGVSRFTEELGHSKKASEFSPDELR